MLAWSEETSSLLLFIAARRVLLGTAERSGLDGVGATAIAMIFEVRCRSSVSGANVAAQSWRLMANTILDSQPPDVFTTPPSWSGSYSNDGVLSFSTRKRGNSALTTFHTLSSRVNGCNTQVGIPARVQRRAESSSWTNRPRTGKSRREKSPCDRIRGNTSRRYVCNPTSSKDSR